MSNGFDSELAMSDIFCLELNGRNSPWGKVSLAKEFNFSRGRTDVIAVDEDGSLHAFELKLEKWSCALTQAYRSTSFAHFSYVVVPEKVVGRALRHAEDFKKRSVGICSIGRDGLNVVLPAVHTMPIQPWLAQAAISAVMGECVNGSV